MAREARHAPVCLQVGTPHPLFIYCESSCKIIIYKYEVYYESRKRELKRRLINEGRCDERLKAKVEESTCLTYTGLNDKTN